MHFEAHFLLFLLAVWGKFSCDKRGVNKFFSSDKGGSIKCPAGGGIWTLPFIRGVMVPFPPCSHMPLPLFLWMLREATIFLKIGEKIGDVDLHSVLKLGSVDLYSVSVFCNFADFAKLNRDRQWKCRSCHSFVFRSPFTFVVGFFAFDPRPSYRASKIVRGLLSCFLITSCSFTSLNFSVDFSAKIAIKMKQ